MREIEYSEAAVEVLDILNYTDKEDVAKIPQSFIKFLIDISSKDYRVKFNHEQPINGLNLKKQTKELLGFIYNTWWDNSEEREKYKKLIHNEDSNKEEIKESYNINDIKEKVRENYNVNAIQKEIDVNDIFKNKKENKVIQNESTMETSVAEYREESLLKKLINKMLSFFGVKKKGDKI